MAKQKRSTASTTSFPPGSEPALIPADRIPQELSFTAAGGLYVIAPGAIKLDAQDQLIARLSQLSALLTMTTGEGSETFNNWNDDYRENYLWCCAMMAKECRTLVSMV